VSFVATRWAWDQLTLKSSTKLVLLAMADCVNAEGGEMLCWPSYRFIAKRTSLDAKTVEAGVYRLREAGLITDTGKRRGETGKVVVYLLNVSENGCITTGPEGEGGPTPQHANDTKSGDVKPAGNDTEIPSNPPKNGAQSPQISGAMTPKAVVRISKGTIKESGKESGKSACAQPPDVADQTWKDWTALRTKKRTTVSETAIAEARKQADLAGLTLERFLQIWCARGSQGLEASWLKPEERRQQQPSEPAWRTEQRQRTQLAAPGVAVKPAAEFFDMEAIDVTARRLG
jgi:hypothetical protein